MEAKRKHVSILVPTYNEEENVGPLAAAITEQFEQNLPQYDFDITFIDNCSTDHTRSRLRALCEKDKRIRAIFNVTNFGQFKSPYYGICQTTGDCTVAMCADFQDPPETLPALIACWEAGHKVVCAVKTQSKENRLVRFLRTCYYKMIRKMSSVRLIEHFTGFGLYDRSFVQIMREVDDPAPFLRGVIAELGGEVGVVEYTQAARRAGKTHNNFHTLYDAAWESFTNYTKTPLRLFVPLGIATLFLSTAGLVFDLVWRLTAGSVGTWWLVPVIGFFAAIQLIGIGVIGEYLFTLRAKVMRRPLVVEEERINFED